MYCMNCGTLLPDSAKFCISCGQKINVPQKPEPPAEEIKEVNEGIQEPRPEAPVEVPVEEPVEAPVEAPVEETVEAPVEAPAEETPAPEEPEASDHQPEEPEKAPEITEAQAPEEILEEPEKAEEVREETPEPPAPAGEEKAPAPAPEPAFKSAPAVQEKIPRRKIWPKIIIAAAAIAVIVVAIVLIVGNSPSSRSAKLIKSADSLAASGRYDEAIAALDEAYEVWPENPDILIERMDVYDMQATAALKNGDVKTAIGAYAEETKLVVGYDEAEKQAFYDSLNDKLDELALNALEKDDLDGVETVLKAKAELIEGYPGAENDLVAIKLTDRITDLARGWVESGDYETAIKLLERKLSIVPALSGETKTEIEDCYKQWAENAISSGEDVEEIKSLRDKLASAAGKYAGISDEIEQLDAVIESSEIEDEYAEFAKNVQPFLEADDIAGAFSYTYDNLVSHNSTYYDIYSALNENNDLSPLVYKAGDKYIGLYVISYSAFLYYGDYVDGQRSGEGRWLYCGGSYLDTSVYYADTTWSNDLPNGSFEAHEYSKESLDAELQTVIIRGEVVDGLYNGEISREYVGKDMTLYGNYDNGTVEILADKDPNGNKTQVIAFSRDKKAWLSTTSFFAPYLQYGIKGFGE
ncbi:MAG: zinc-ribbon domain-containing protein [Oscillospiraceae bacterium]|nr:zinc-ribbon domain-containing protein [Oscillospiraceae bacterium]